MKLVFFTATLAFALSVWAHGGEDHGEGNAPVTSAGIAPRAVALSEEFELVAVLTEGRLTVYLDRYADNAPVADAEIEIESGTMKSVAVQVAPGVYALSGDAFANPGRYPLTVSVQAGENSDLLTAALEVAAPAAARAQKRTAWAFWGGALALLVGAALLALRRRKNRED